ncbi:hypothetical protein IWQ61_006089 [Dispira simplex]|nr:hypothetical protein IWQ61_006089 [Dispira simplex]
MATQDVDFSSVSSAKASHQEANSTMVRLTCLMVSGNRHTFQFPPNATIKEVKLQIFDEWPKDWEGERPASPGFLRLVYLGKFLSDVTTLPENKLVPGKPIIVHLIIKMVEDSDLFEGPRDLEKAPKCHCAIL